MIVALCASLSFFKTSKTLKKKLEVAGITVLWPWGMEMIEKGKLTKKNMPAFKKKYQHTVIKRHYEKIKQADAVLIINEEKNGVKHYIGGNTLMEMGFAHILDKPLYVLYPIPDVAYREEIVAMRPKVLSGSVDLLIKTKKAPYGRKG